MKNIIGIVALMYLAFFFASCDDSDNGNEQEQRPDAPLTFKVDGTWFGFGFEQSAASFLDYSDIGGGFSLLVFGSTDTTSNAVDFISLAIISNQSLREGPYPLQSEGDEVATMVFAKITGLAAGGVWDSENEIGSITLEEFDETNRMIKGSFQADLRLDPSSSLETPGVISITDGAFELPF